MKGFFVFFEISLNMPSKYNDFVPLGNLDQRVKNQLAIAIKKCYHIFMLRSKRQKRKARKKEMK